MRGTADNLHERRWAKESVAASPTDDWLWELHMSIRQLLEIGCYKLAKCEWCRCTSEVAEDATYNRAEVVQGV